MFTGIIKDCGKLSRISPNEEGAYLEFSTSLAPQIQIDDSVSCNGICLTATKVTPHSFFAQAVHMTLEKTSLKNWKVGDVINHELALTMATPLGGHMVTGHVQEVTTIESILQRGENWEFTFSLPLSSRHLILSEGSIALDGISLTVAKVTPMNFTVSIIPHTFEKTNFHRKKIGDPINLEVDMMAKYIESSMKHYLHQMMDNLLDEKLKQKGLI